MALSPHERDVILRRIGDFLEGEFARVLAQYYARTVAYAAKHPQNINNELRNAVTHMSRALVASDIATASSEMDAAERHVERFKRDCLKVAVVYAGKNASELMKRAELAGARVDPELTLAAAAVVTKRYQILMDEVLGDPKTVAKWEALLLDIERIRAKVMGSYNLLDHGKYRVPLLVLRTWRILKQAWLWVGFTIAATALGAAAIPDEQGFGEAAQKAVISVVKVIIRSDDPSFDPPIANTPSTGD